MVSGGQEFVVVAFRRRRTWGDGDDAAPIMGERSLNGSGAFERSEESNASG